MPCSSSHHVLLYLCFYVPLSALSLSIISFFSIFPSFLCLVHLLCSAVPSLSCTRVMTKDSQILGFPLMPPGSLLSMRITVIGKVGRIFGLFIWATVLKSFVYWGIWSEILIPKKHHKQLRKKGAGPRYMIRWRRGHCVSRVVAILSWVFINIRLILSRLFVG